MGTLDLLAHRDALRQLLDHPPAGLFLDLDGTLAPIAPTPDAVSIRPSLLDALDTLAQRMLVTVLTGRQVSTARAIAGLDSLIYAGNHGAEWWQAGEEWTDPEVAEAIPLVHSLASSIQRALESVPGLVIEDKGISLSVHYRLAEDPSQTRDAIMRFLDDAPESSRLSVREGKLVVEVRPLAAVDKGTALRQVVERHGLRSALAMGDDRTDIDAFRALVELRRKRAFVGITVAVLGANVPAQLVELADYHLASVAETEIILRWLAEISSVS